MSKQTKTSVSGKAVDLVILRRIFRYVKPYKGNFYSAVLTTITLAAITPLRPYLIKFTLDEYVAKSNAQMLWIMTMVLIGLLVMEAVIQFGDSYLTNRLGQSIIKDLRIQLYKHILNLRLKYYDNTPIGTLVTRSVSDIEVIADIFQKD